MGFFSRRKSAHRDREGEARASYATEANNPELIAAEEAVKHLAPPPPSTNVLRDVYFGSAPQIVEPNDDNSAEDA